MQIPELLYQTGPEWLEAVMADFNRFLQDHAAAEKKAAGMAISMASHYPDRPKLVEAMADLAVEEMSHYREVVKLIHQRGIRTTADEKDPYVIAFRQELRSGREDFFLDRLLVGGIIEARGAERFGLVAEGLPEGSLQNFYRSITRSEERHLELFIELAGHYFKAQDIQQRLQELLEIEAEIARAQPPRAALH